MDWFKIGKGARQGYVLSPCLFGPIASWQIDGETREKRRDLIFLGSKITLDNDCSHEIKTLAPWKKSYDKPRQRIEKQRCHFAYKVPYSQSYGFSCPAESWTIKKAECRRIGAFELWYWSLLRVAWTARRSNQSILKEINPEYSLERLAFLPMLDVEAEAPTCWSWSSNNADIEAPILWPPDVKSQLIGKDPDIGKDWGQEEKGATQEWMFGWHH